jgi:F1F0 ATPase subunit 2
VLGIALGALVGAALAGVHLATLWWSVKRAASAPRPALVIAATAFARIGLVAIGFSLVALRGLSPLIAAFAGFLVMRAIVLARVPREGRARGDGGAA